MKYTIGIPMYNLGENSAGVTKPYLEFFRNFGQIILLAPDCFIPDLDLLVLPGGKDVAAGNGEEFSFLNSDNERFLEHFDRMTLPKYIDNATPIYGICRGFQTLMRHFGIPITQDIDWNHGYSKDENDSKVHNLTFAKYQHWGKDNGQIGSWHHQGVTLEDFKKQDQFDLIAYQRHHSGDEYSIVEFVEHKTLPIIGEQSHPERNQNGFEAALIGKLLETRNEQLLETFEKKERIVK